MSDDLIKALSILDERRPLYVEAQQMYDGTAPEAFASTRIAKLVGQSSAGMRVPLASRCVDLLADRLEINAVTTEAGAETALEEIWEYNDLDLESGTVHTDTGKFGDFYALVWPDKEGKRAEIFFHSPLSMVIVYDTENPREKRFAALVWQEGKRYRANLFYADRLEKYITKTDDAKGRELADWEPFEAEDEPWPIQNPYGQVPVFHFRTARPYGEPDHKRAYGPQRAIDKLVASQMATVDTQAFPQRYGLTDPEAELDDDDDLYDDTEMSPERQQPSQLEAGPGKLWKLSGMKAVGQFDAADSEEFLRPLRFYIKAMSELTAIPSSEFDESADPESGESRRRKEASLTKRAERRQRSYGGTWKDLLEYALLIHGVTAQVEISWAPVQTIEDKEGVETAKAKTELGVPAYQALLELGYTTEQLDEWFGADQAQGRITPQDLAAIAQRLYLAVPDLLSADEARAILNRAGANLTGAAPTPPAPAAPTFVAAAAAEAVNDAPSE